jgi:hypothetical protein
VRLEEVQLALVDEPAVPESGEAGAESGAGDGAAGAESGAGAGAARGKGEGGVVSVGGGGLSWAQIRLLLRPTPLEAVALGHLGVLLLVHLVWLAADPCLRSKAAPARCAACGKRRVRILFASVASIVTDVAALGLVVGVAYLVAYAKEKYDYADLMKKVAFSRYLVGYLAVRVIYDALKTLFDYRDYIALVARDPAIKAAITGAACDDPDADAASRQSKCYGTALPSGATVRTEDLKLSAPGFRNWMAIGMREALVGAALVAFVSFAVRLVKASRGGKQA